MIDRKRRGQGMFISLMALCFVAGGGTALAATTPQVSGTVTADGSPAANASVNVVCTAAGVGHTRNTATSSTGHYSVSFSAGQCDDGSSVTVTATSNNGDANGQTTGVMGVGGTAQRATLDVALVATAPVPEFGALPLAMAVAGAGVVLVRVRRPRFTG